MCTFSRLTFRGENIERDSDCVSELHMSDSSGGGIVSDEDDMDARRVARPCRPRRTIVVCQCTSYQEGFLSAFFRVVSPTFRDARDMVQRWNLLVRWHITAFSVYVGKKSCRALGQ